MDEANFSFVIVDADNLKFENFKAFWSAGQVENTTSPFVRQQSYGNALMLRVPEYVLLYCNHAWHQPDRCIESQVQLHSKVQLLTAVMLPQKAGYEVYGMQALELNPKVSKDIVCSALAPHDADTAKHAS